MDGRCDRASLKATYLGWVPILFLCIFDTLPIFSSLPAIQELTCIQYPRTISQRDDERVVLIATTMQNTNYASISVMALASNTTLLCHY